MNFPKLNMLVLLASTLRVPALASPKVIGTEFDRLGPEFGATQGPPQTTTASSYRFSPKPFDPVEYGKFARAFSLPYEPKGSADGKIRSITGGGKTLLYLEEKSEIFFSDEVSPDMDRSDSLNDGEKRALAGNHLKKLLGKQLEDYVFVNDERNFRQENSDAAPVEIAYYARYAKVLDGRPILGNQFQIRIGIGHKGCLKEFSFRDPLVHSKKIHDATPSTHLPERLLSAIQANAARNTPNGPIPISLCKPYKRFPAFVVDGEPGSEQLLPVTSFLAEVELDPIALNLSGLEGLEPTYVEHYNIPDIEP